MSGPRWEPGRDRRRAGYTCFSPREISMSRPKMLILRGNAAGAGSYPDEQGKLIAWPSGALHEWAATEYARRRGYEGVVLSVPGQPQSQTSPQATAALKRFFDDPTVAAFYGFSGGGYNLRHILIYLASKKPEALHRIDLIVALGVGDKDKEGHIMAPESDFKPAAYNAIARTRVRPAKWEDAKWDVVYKTNPSKLDMSTYLPALPKGIDSHMFGPDVLLAQTPAGRYRDGWPDDD